MELHHQTAKTQTVKDLKLFKLFCGGSLLGMVVFLVESLMRFHLTVRGVSELISRELQASSASSQQFSFYRERGEMGVLREDSVGVRSAR